MDGDVGVKGTAVDVEQAELLGPGDAVAFGTSHVENTTFLVEVVGGSFERGGGWGAVGGRASVVVVVAAVVVAAVVALAVSATIVAVVASIVVGRVHSWWSRIGGRWIVRHPPFWWVHGIPKRENLRRGNKCRKKKYRKISR